MKLIYHCEFSDFRALFPANESLRAKPGPLYLGIIFALFFVGFGLLTLLQDAGPTSSIRRSAEPPAALAFIAIGAAVGAASYFQHKRTTKKLHERFEAALREKFKGTHCLNRREIELSAEGIRTTCNCGSTLRPWSELVGFAENAQFFQLGTRQETHVVPKRIFASESERTEFRTLISQKAERIQVLTGTRVQFAYTKADYKKAKMLHYRKGTSRRFKLEVLAMLMTLAWLCFYGLKHSFGLPIGVAEGIGIFGLCAVLRLMPLIKRPRQRFHGLLTALFNESGIQLQDASGMASLRWQDYNRFVEDDSYWLLYHKNKTYRIFPKRAFQQQQATEFGELIEQRLGASETQAAH